MDGVPRQPQAGVSGLPWEQPENLDTIRAQLCSWEFPARPEFVSQARSLAAQQLEDWGHGVVALTAEMIVSELVTNAVRYGGGTDLRLRLTVRSSLVVEVSDQSRCCPRLRRPCDDDEGGRGMRLVADLAQRWGFHHETTEGKTVWAELKLHTAGDP
nr:ATP-binding protein [Streptomyces sp. NBC_00830]WTB35827.1 ATP-binding protein [Streptomyces sp. NBC_00830]